MVYKLALSDKLDYIPKWQHKLDRFVDLYYAAACQTDFAAPTSRGEIATRTERMAELVKHTITGYEPFFDVRLLAFPEFAHAAPIYQTVDELREKLAVEVPNEHTESYTRLAN